MINSLFLNLHVKNLEVSNKFFTGLGFELKPEFSDEHGSCVILGANTFLMLLEEDRFKGYTHREIPDTTKTAETIISFSAQSREEVDSLQLKALELGATKLNPPMDYGWLYGKSFIDPDGHLFEVFYMDEAQKPKKS